MTPIRMTRRKKKVTRIHICGLELSSARITMNPTLLTKLIIIRYPEVLEGINDLPGGLELIL